tara:strand:- start:16682 stop:17356 length:675 start_codon:yes stop_codon:yes gene_type:complete
MKKIIKNDMTETNPRENIPSPLKVELKDTASVFEGHLKIKKYQLRHELFQGGWSQTLYREVMSQGSTAVAVLPFDPYRQEIVLIEQFRIGVWAAQSNNPWILECVAGLSEDEENAEDVAIRETLEESGCSILRLHPIATYYTTPGCSDQKVQLFCGEIDSKDVYGVHGVKDEGEDIRAKAWPINKAFDMLNEGTICNSTTMIALQWLMININSLTTKWTSTLKN